MTIDILGTKYKIIKKKMHDEKCDGYCDYTSKEIVIRKDNYNNVGNFDWLMKKQLRHEIIHAFLSESGCNQILNIARNLDMKKQWLIGLQFSFQRF